MTRWIAALSLPLTLLFVACDSEPVDERSGEAQIAAADEAADAGEAGHFAHRGHKGPPGARLCAMVECSDAQASAVAETSSCPIALMRCSGSFRAGGGSPAR